MNLLHKKMLLIMLLLAAPLSAQVPAQVTIEPAQVTVQNYLDSIFLTVDWPGPDSAQVAREEAAVREMQRIADILAECGCVDSGPSNVTVVANAGLTLAAFLIAWQLKGIKNKEHPEHPSQPEEPEEPDYGEGDGSR